MPPKKLSQLKEVCVCATQGCSRFNYVEDGITWPGVQLTLNVVKSHRLANERAKTSHRNVDSTPMVNRFHGLSLESNQLIATQQLGSSNTSLPPDLMLKWRCLRRQQRLHLNKFPNPSQMLHKRRRQRSEDSPNNHGSNYKQWEASIDQTPMHAFCVTTTFVNNKDCLSSLTSQQEASICGLLKHTICDSHDKNVEAGGMEKPNEVFNYLKTKCSHSDRRSKIELASTLLQLANDTSPSDDFTVSKWSKNLSALTKLQSVSCFRTLYDPLLVLT
ncbi:hypothetical protein PSTT_13526, partial [Puccinia striiformis]